MATNYIAILNEYAQKKGWKVRYQEVGTDGPDHNKTFVMKAVVDDTSYPDGVGRNKKEAKQSAAKSALSSLTEAGDSTRSCCSSVIFLKRTQPNYTCWLNEYSQKNRLDFKPIETTSISGTSNQLCRYGCKYVLGEKEFPEAACNGKKEAKETAAKHVYEELIKEIEILDGNSNRTQHSLSSRQSCFNPDFKLVDKRGLAHNQEFVQRNVINPKEYPKGHGKTAKESKQNIPEQSEWNSQTSFVSSVPEDESPLHNSVAEPEDDISSSKNVSEQVTSTSDFIIFRDTSVPAQNTNNPVPKPSPLDVKPKRRLAANFQNSPNKSKEEAPNINANNLTVRSTNGTLASNQAGKSRFLDDFDSISRVGKGGFGRVFKARRKLEQTYYAVKIVNCTDKSLREVDALAKLAHNNIVRYYTSWIEETAYRCESSDNFSTSNSSFSSASASEFLYIQMEYCEGETLQAWIFRRKSYPEQDPNRRQEAAQIMKQVLEAVKYIHSKNLIHRDLKPANIMFGNDKAVKVGDFGLVAEGEGDDDKCLLQRTKHTGTPTYMSPEQLSQDSYDRKVDIFPLGLIYFELLWNLETVNEKQKTWKNIRSQKLPKGFKQMFDSEMSVIEKMLCGKPEERPDATELLMQLDPYSELLQLDQRTRNWNRENRTY